MILQRKDNDYSCLQHGDIYSWIQRESSYVLEVLVVLVADPVFLSAGIVTVDRGASCREGDVDIDL